MRRKTAQRDAIREVFLTEDRPLRVEDVLRLGKELVSSLNQATVYRNIKLLLEERFIKAVLHPRLGTFYEVSRMQHHHHFHCRACDRLFRLDGCALDEQKSAPMGFTTEGHDLFFFGLCPSCGTRISGP